MSPGTSSSGTPSATTPPASAADVAAAVAALREAGPLVHCLTNSVVREVTANVLLAAGAAPAMIDHPAEAGEFAAIASAVLVNVGNPSGEQIDAMKGAIAAATAAGRPWVLDPVAVGGLTLRTALATRWLDHSPAAIRANASEAIALAGAGEGGRGVDSTVDVADAESAARDLAERTGAVVAVSGPHDLVVSAGRATWITSGHPLMQQVIGTGCALGALTAAYLGTDGVDPHVAVVAAHAHSGAAGTVAGRQAAGPGSFAPAWLDALAALGPDDVVDLVTLDEG